MITTIKYIIRARTVSRRGRRRRRRRVSYARDGEKEIGEEIIIIIIKT